MHPSLGGLLIMINLDDQFIHTCDVVDLHFLFNTVTGVEGRHLLIKELLESR